MSATYSWLKSNVSKSDLKAGKVSVLRVEGGIKQPVQHSNNCSGK